MPFMHVGTYPTRNFATLGLLELQPPFTKQFIRCVNILLQVFGTGQASGPILHLAILQSPVFLRNSRHSHFFAASSEAPLLPKIQGEFAEFLQNDSLNALVCSTCSPVSDSGTVDRTEVFPGTPGKVKHSPGCASL